MATPAHHLRRVDSAVQKYLLTISKVVQKHDTHYKHLAKMTRDRLNHPVPLTIGSCVEEKCKNNQVFKELTPMKIYYIPLKGTFKAFFERPEVLKAVIKYMNELHPNGFSNKPPPFLWDDVKNKTLSLSGSETLTLFLISPFLIGDIIDLEDEVWEFYLVTREILDIIEAREIEIGCTHLFDTLVETHHEMFIRLFKRGLRPKQHNMVHYGSCIGKGGPMSNIKTARFEANHKFFKSAADSTSSRREITYTLSMKNQYNFHYYMKYGDGINTNAEVGPVTRVPFHITDTRPSLSGTSSQCTWAKVKGIQYNIGTCVAINLDDRDVSISGIIESISINTENVNCWLLKCLTELCMRSKSAGQEKLSSSPMSIIDHIMAGIEDILGKHGNHHLRDKFKRFDNTYIRPHLVRNYCGAEPKILETYSKLTMRDAMDYIRRNATTIGNISGLDSTSTIFKTASVSGQLQDRAQHITSDVVDCYEEVLVSSKESVNNSEYSSNATNSNDRLVASDDVARMREDSLADIEKNVPQEYCHDVYNLGPLYHVGAQSDILQEAQTSVEMEEHSLVTSQPEMSEAAENGLRSNQTTNEVQSNTRAPPVVQMPVGTQIQEKSQGTYVGATQQRPREHRREQVRATLPMYAGAGEQGPTRQASGENERIAPYLIRIRLIVGHSKHPPSKEVVFDIVIRNWRPEVHRFLEIKDVRKLTEIQYYGKEFEEQLEWDARYISSLSQDKSRIPGAAYQSSGSAPKKLAATKLEDATGQVTGLTIGNEPEAKAAESKPLPATTPANPPNANGG
ncbi:hypothetical protein QAD02_008232 [Eretmocerus hayati]|uniref:Uncharacterized protein n=1 Tax=Eretmocerus hayati TaxID=131215 RepID=A0ACC2NA91_9HYME|nr:hypothetical protein QAD02_008232 [Eretmocerus hayati]